MVAKTNPITGKTTVTYSPALTKQIENLQKKLDAFKAKQKSYAAETKRNIKRNAKKKMK